MGDGHDLLPEALLELARAAGMMAQWEMAERAGLRAYGLAAERREARVQLAAEAILESLRNEQTAQADPAPEPDPSLAAEAELLALSFARSLEACTG